MVFSSLPPYQLDPVPNWQPHPPGGVCANNDTNSGFPIPPQPMPPPHGNSMAERSRLTKLPQQETGHKCPRCASTNTKFCYYNNYSLSQPRHFCKTCRRYWTRGGTLRNVPVGGGYRRNNKKSKRSRSKSPVTNISTTIRTSPSSCTTDNFIGYNIVPHSVVPQFPLLPSLNHDSDFGAEDNIASSFGRIQPPAFASSGYIDDRWRMQEFPILGERELPPSMTSSEYGIKAVNDRGPPQINLVKFEENQEIMSLPKNSLEFQGNDYHRYWSNGDAWNDPNSSRSSIDHFL